MKLSHIPTAVKYAAYTLAASPFFALAEGEVNSAGTSPITVGSGNGWQATYAVGDLAAVNSAATGLQTMFENILGKLVPVVGCVLLAGVALWALPRIVGTIKTAFQQGKGR